MNLTNWLKVIVYRLASCLPDFIWPKQATILMYHSVRSEHGIFFNVSPEEFAWQMNYLANNGYRVISLNELLKIIQAGEKIRNRLIVITFDDGYQDNFSEAYPILKKHNFPATIFVATGLIGQSRKTSQGKEIPLLDWEDIFNMHKDRLIDFEPHTEIHSKLTQLPLDQAKREIEQSKQTLESGLSKQCPFFAYPYGAVNESVKETVKKYFVAAVGVKKGTVSAQAQFDLMELPRNSVDSQVGKATFKVIAKHGRL